MSSNDPWIGKTIGGCRVEKLVGEGAMGGVYLASHPRWGRKVAVKLLHPALLSGEKGKRAKKRLKSEAYWSSLIDHPNLVRVYDYGEDQGTYYIAMEYIEGKTLLNILLEEGVRTEVECLRIAREVISALAAAHHINVIHRDIKPANIMITEQGDVKLTDFGLAKTTDRMSSISQTGQIIGTIYYMSPEQAMGTKKIDARSDFYSLGITLYQALTGKVPYPGRTPLQVLQQHISAPVPRLSKEIPDILPALEDFISKLMAKKPQHRFASSQQILDAIDLCEKSLKSSRKVRNYWDNKSLSRLTLFSKKYDLTPLPIWIISLVTLFVLGFAISFLSQKPYLADFPSELHPYQVEIRKVIEFAEHDQQAEIRQVLQNLDSTAKEDELIANYVNKMTGYDVFPLIHESKTTIFGVFPSDQTEVYREKIVITGKVRGKVDSVLVNGEKAELTFLEDYLFQFKKELRLIEGSNPILILAKNESGKALTEKRISLIYQSDIWNDFQENLIDYSVTDVRLVDEMGKKRTSFRFYETVAVEVNWKITRLIGDFKQILTIECKESGAIATISRSLGKATVDKGFFREKISLKELKPGSYTLYVNLIIGDVVRCKSVTFEVEEIPQKIEKILLTPQSIEVQPGENVDFSVKGVNTWGLETEFNPYWIPSGGKIKDGKFQAGEQVGDFIVIVQDRQSGTQAQSIVKVRSKEKIPQLGWFGEEMPRGMTRGEKRGEYIWQKDNSVMLYVPAGDFWSGSNQRRNEAPVQKVFLEGFYIDKYEVSWERYLQFCRETNTKVPKKPEWQITKDQPVVNISWEAANAYAKWCGKRLPLEMEWEKAARGGFKIPVWMSDQVPISLMLNPRPRRQYPWGDSLPNEEDIFRCNYVANDEWQERDRDGYLTVAPVESFTRWASPYQCVGMAGNVWEWCQDTYQENLPSLNNSAKTPRMKTSFKRVLRGGSWYNHAESCRATRRNSGRFNESYNFVGMRLAFGQKEAR